MEFNEKLRLLRQKKEWTQEELASQLYVSRTAISKWESGKGYPAIDSLKKLAEIFGVSIDELLSNEELVIAAQSDTQNKLQQVYSFVYGLLDLLPILCIFLPFYGQMNSGHIQAVSLLKYTDISQLSKISYYILLLLMAGIGCVNLLLELRRGEKTSERVGKISLVVQGIVILFFAMARQPYLTAFLFFLFSVKIALLFHDKKCQKHDD